MELRLTENCGIGMLSHSFSQFLWCVYNTLCCTNLVPASVPHSTDTENKKVLDENEKGSECAMV